MRRKLVVLAVLTCFAWSCATRELTTDGSESHSTIRLEQSEVSTTFDWDAGVSGEDCREQGGSIKRRGLSGMRMCVVPYPDANRPCKDNIECKGRCLFILGGDIEEPLPGDHVQGACEPDSATFGCYMEIRNGVAQQAKCDD